VCVAEREIRELGFECGDSLLFWSFRHDVEIIDGGVSKGQATD
jgi:hydroxymethylpyrimidine pyrophosphatase-like HAD family hydrolase